jgi:butyrate kinase
MLKLLVINPGSTTTKLGLFDEEKPLAVRKYEHPAYELERFPRVQDQYPLRRRVMMDFLAENHTRPEELAAVVSRGGLLKPIPSGTYRIGQAMLDDLNQGKYGEHASNIAAILAFGFEWDYRIPAFVVDPPVVDELTDQARLSGLKELPRRVAWHALNIMATVRQACARESWDFRAENFVVAHIGGGISVAAIEKGRCIDVSNGLEEGPFTPERAGGLPCLELVKLAFSGKHTQAELKKMLVGRGGLVNYLGTSNLPQVENRIAQGDDYARLVFSAMAYQIAKTIGSYFVPLKGNVRRIILTGGGAHSVQLTNRIREYVEPLSPVLLIPGEDELAALVQGALRVLRGEEKALEYSAVP